MLSLKFKEAGEDTQMASAITALERSLQTFAISARTGNVFDVKCLQTVAAIRTALNVLSEYLDETFDKNLENYKHFKNFLDVARNLCGSEKRSSIRLFLLKQLVRRNGIDSVKKQCESKELQWLLPQQHQVMSCISCRYCDF